MEEHYRAVVDELRADPAVSEALMMGRPSLKHGSKMFGGYRDGRGACGRLAGAGG
ncbi:MAG TPA: hypothetical protein VNO82_18635 [Solirubrobacteraceae bacterium]|nr:hypothetical protein [Solirubrobacteraceae bacterium]